MKYLLAILILCSTVSASVRNATSSQTRRDSVAIWVVCLDSTGKPSTCDSFFVRVVNNSTNAVLFSDSGTTAMTGLDTINGLSEYYYHRQVSDIDGGGTDGEYILAVIAKKNAGSGWKTPNSRVFEIQNNIVADSLVLKRMGVYNTTDNAVEWTSTANSKGAFVLSATGTGTVLGSAFRLYSKYGSGLLGIAGSLHSDNLAAGIAGYDSSTSGAGILGRGLASGYGIMSYDDAGVTYNTALSISGVQTDGISAGSVAANAIGASELADDAAREIASHILKDTTKRIGVKGGLGDSVLTPIPTVTVGDVTLAASQPNYAPVKVGDTDELRANIVTALGIPLKPSDTDELRANIIAAMTVPLKPSDTDELRANIIAAMPNNEVWTAAQRDSVIARQLALRDTAHIIDSIVKAMSPILTQAMDSINAISTWLDPTLDSLLYASGFKQGARSIQGVSNDCDTLHVKIGTTEWFKMLFYHVGGTPGARPDSTITVAP